MQLQVNVCHRCRSLLARVCHVTDVGVPRERRRPLSTDRQSLNDSQLNQYLSEPLAAKYPQKLAEKFWSQYWHNNGLFSDSNGSTTADDSSRPVFSVLLPPPNITGNLHLGHALTLAIEDTLCRYYRMRGHRVRWTPGLDHAGIATQMVVDKYLRQKSGKTRHELTPEEFIREVKDWKCKRESHIRDQLIRLGASVDFERQYYTLSEEMSDTVSEAFILLFNAGHIYRHSMAVNWSYYLRSTLSDIEVDHRPVDGPTHLSVPGFDGQVLVGVMYRFNYPIDGTDGDVIPVATTRLETILGDVAVAVHPKDGRYRHLIGRKARHPLTGRLMPIVGDESVRQDMGTGAVKITPGHSQLDYAVAERHGLPIVDIFDESGCVRCPEQPLYDGLHRFEAKQVMLEELQRLGLYIDEQPHRQSVPVCSRSGDLIETRRVPQWFFKCSERHRLLAQFVVNRDMMSDEDREKWLAIKESVADDDRHLSVVPPNYRNVWRDWFSRWEDWCISRQIVWGHRIPAYNVIKRDVVTDEWIAAKSASEAQAIAQKRWPNEDILVRQDTDVLDTWFSSALLPLNVNGWPARPLTANTDCDNKYFPLSLMETGRDIIFFWVARMVILSLSLTNRLPFNRVLLHGMVCDSDGHKMSKSKGNVIDPLDIVDGISLNSLKDKSRRANSDGLLSDRELDVSLQELSKRFPKGMVASGADALRQHLLELDFKQEMVAFDPKKVVITRNFCNKMHQTVRFFAGNLGQEFNQMDVLSLTPHLTPMDRWILSSLVKAIKTANQTIEAYDLGVAARALRHFWHHQLCDVYIEHMKTVLRNTAPDSQTARNVTLNVLAVCIGTGLRALHPFQPFITEDLWQHMRRLMHGTNHQLFEFRSIGAERYPVVDTSSGDDQWFQTFDYTVGADIQVVEAVIARIRSLRQTYRMPKSLLQNQVVLLAINGDLLDSYRDLIASASGVAGVELVSIHDIHRYDNYLCFKIHLSDNQEVSDGSSSGQDNEEIDDDSPNCYDDCYLLINVDMESLEASLSATNADSSADRVIQDLKRYKCYNFHQNYWKTKSLRQKS